MKQKMLKLIKILNQFTIDDILTMSEFSENEAKKLITEFEDIDLIKKISEELEKSVDEIFFIDTRKNWIDNKNKSYKLKDKKNI